MQIDHLMWACSDLDVGIREIEDLTGVKAEYSGSHDKMGTRNALLSMGDTYLEIIAPDPAQSLVDNFGSRLANLKSSGLVAFAMNCADLDTLKSNLSKFKTSEVRETRRTTTSGEVLVWKLLFIGGLEGAPFFIDWLECVHPAKTSPQGCALLELVIEGPAKKNTTSLQSLMNQNGVPQLVRFSDASDDKRIRLHASIESPNGRVWLDPIAESIALF